MLALFKPTISSPYIKSFTKQETSQTFTLPNTTEETMSSSVATTTATPSSSPVANGNTASTPSTSFTLKNARPSFPSCLHAMLSQADCDGYTDIASWQPHGRAFRIHKHKEFMKNVMPRMFRQSKWSSFQRQINLYGFTRITVGPDKGAYYHENFLRGDPDLASVIVRIRVKGTKVRVSSNPDRDPDFYAMPNAEELLKKKDGKQEDKSDIENKNDKNSSPSASSDEKESKKIAPSPQITLSEQVTPIIKQEPSSSSSSRVVSLPPSRVSTPKDSPITTFQTTPKLPEKNTTSSESTTISHFVESDEIQDVDDDEFSHLLKNVFGSASETTARQQVTPMTTSAPFLSLVNVVEPDSSSSSRSSSMNDIVHDEELRDLLKNVFGASPGTSNNCLPTSQTTTASSSTNCEELSIESSSIISLQQDNDAMYTDDMEWGDALDSMFD